MLTSDIGARRISFLVRVLANSVLVRVLPKLLQLIRIMMVIFDGGLSLGGFILVVRAIDKVLVRITVKSIISFVCFFF